MFAGVPGQGAEDAWWLTSLTLEANDAMGNAFSGGSADIQKHDSETAPIHGR